MEKTELEKQKSRERYHNWYHKNPEKNRKKKTLYMREWRKMNPEKAKASWKRAKQKQRAKLLKIYGEECALCGFNNPKALTLDHINQNGNEERKRLGERGVYYRALEKYRPDEYRILCMNCQFITRN